MKADPEKIKIVAEWPQPVIFSHIHHNRLFLKAVHFVALPTANQSTMFFGYTGILPTSSPTKGLSSLPRFGKAFCSAIGASVRLGMKTRC